MEFLCCNPEIQAPLGAITNSRLFNTMFTRIELKNFRKHERYSVSCRERNILVGPNNAGKSSLLDALRLFADVQRFASRRAPIFKSYENKGVCSSYDASNSIFSVTLENISRNYSSEYAEVIVTNNKGSKLNIRVNPDSQPEIFIETDEKPQKSKNFFQKCFPERVIVVPTLSQFEESEKPNDPDYVRSVEFTRLAARNFRNIWRNKSDDDFSEFRELVQAHWPGIDITAPELTTSFPPSIHMYYSENGRQREIYWSGFGFQAWLQMMTHFLRGATNDILVLDEPDVYLHADLQRRLFHISKKRFQQIFVATHSSEIMNEANASDVILIKPGSVSGSRITSEAGYRSAHALLGSSENADFARLARAKRIVAFEGNDRTIFKRFEAKLRKGGVLSDPDTLSVKIGGFEHWHRVDNLSWMFKELFGMEAKIVALFDRDYRSDAEIVEFEEKLAGSGVVCRVLRRKEVENYLVEVGPISKAIQSAANRRGFSLTEAEIGDILRRLADDHYEDALINSQSFASKYALRKRDSQDQKIILKAAKMEFDSDWNTVGYKKRIGGKQYIIDLNSRLQDVYGFSITNAMIVEAFEANDLDPEFVEIIELVNTQLS